MSRTSWNVLSALDGRMCLMATLLGVIAVDAEQTNHFPNPGFGEFSDGLPTGWTLNSWNQPGTKVAIHRLEPGRDGTGHCLEVQPTTPINVARLFSPPFPVLANQDYLFKGYYASTSRSVTTNSRFIDASAVSLTGHWLDADSAEVGTFKIEMPDTQDRWVEVFQDVRTPETARSLQIEVARRWVGGRLRLDDFSLREGSIRDYIEEFSITEVADEEFFPIYGWLTPGSPSDQYAGMDTDKYNADYAVANFNINLEQTAYAGFGVKYRPLGKLTDEQIIESGKDPRVWWFGGASEPGNKDFPELAAATERIRRLAPSKDYWVVLFPTYADDFHGRPEEYDEHVRLFLETVKPKHFTYDHYCMVGHDPRVHADSWYSPNREGDYFPNLEIVRHRALEADVEFGVIVSVGTFGPNRGVSEAEMRFQAFTTLAYGARSLGWFTYLTEIPYGHWTNWEDHVINRDGTRTRHYAMVKYVNSEVLALAPTLLRLESTGVYHTQPLPPWTRSVTESPLVESVEGGMGLVGEFVAEDGDTYLMVVNRDFIEDATLRLSLRNTPTAVFEVSKQTGAEMVANGYSPDTRVLTLDLAGGDGRLFRLE